MSEYKDFVESTGYTGVAERKIKSGVRYRAFIVIDNQNISLGHYDTI